MPQKKSKIKWYIIINLAILFFLAVAFGKEYVGNLQIEREISALQAQKAELESNQLDTLNLISELSSEYYLEQEGRTKQGLGREGEMLVIIQDENQSGADKDAYDLEDFDLEASGNMTRWFYYFFANDKFEQLRNL